MSKNILVVAAHPDDEVLGCGGAMARHVEQGDKVGVIFVADGVAARGDHFEDELKERKKEALEALKILGSNCLGFLDFSDNRLDSIPLLDIVQKLENIISVFKPSIVYTHHHGDLNIDHQIVHRATMTACRPMPNNCVKEIYAFEVVSSTEWGIGDSFSPNYFVDIDDFFERKVQALKAYKTEMRAFPCSRSIEHVKALAIHRGASVGSKKAEAYVLIRKIA